MNKSSCYATQFYKTNDPIFIGQDTLFLKNNEPYF